MPAVLMARHWLKRSTHPAGSRGFLLPYRNVFASGRDNLSRIRKEAANGKRRPGVVLR